MRDLSLAVRLVNHSGSCCGCGADLYEVIMEHVIRAAMPLLHEEAVTGEHDEDMWEDVTKTSINQARMLAKRSAKHSAKRVRPRILTDDDLPMRKRS